MNKPNTQQLLSFLKLVEGCKLTAYLDSAGVPTIGVGMTKYPNGRIVTLRDPEITKNQADEMCLELVKPYADAVINNVKQELKDYQITSLISFCYNQGIHAFLTSTLLDVINNNPSDFLNIQRQLNRWVFYTDKTTKQKVKSNGLVNRRRIEYNMYSGMLQMG